MRQLAFCLLLFAAAPSAARAQQTIRDQVINGITEEVRIVEYPALSLREMTSMAGAAVQVKIRSADTIVSDAGTAVVTDYRVAVVGVIKDVSGRINAGDVITVRRAGGVANVEGRTYFSNESGFPQFANAGEYVLFLKTDSGQPFAMVAGGQSAFRVHQGTVSSLATASGAPSVVLLPLFLQEVREQLAYHSHSTR